MSIAVLPRSTISAIGSTSALHDSCSVIKELVDNALDANSTSVSVEVSLNVLDVLQVKDNGSGIAPDDRGLVCKPSHTSKIQSFQDLRRAYCASLGFRGLALASIVEMSASVFLTTRTHKEPVGTSLQYDQTGKVVRRDKVAHPVGTTVRVAEFMKHLPVRRKASLKTTAKILSNIRKLLQAYAMARPNVRFSLKVMGANGDGDWIYPAKSESTVMDAVLKVAGSDTASQCMTKLVETSHPSDALEDSPKLSKNAGNTRIGCIRISAVVLKKDSDLDKACRCGQYISVNGRPLSTDKGIAKSFIKLYKSFIRSIVPGNQVRSSLMDPFLCLHLSLPPGSYDANVEPRKDDILLDHQSLVLSAVENIFKEVYEDHTGGDIEVVVTSPETTSHGAGSLPGAEFEAHRMSPSGTATEQWEAQRSSLEVSPMTSPHINSRLTPSPRSMSTNGSSTVKPVRSPIGTMDNISRAKSLRTYRIQARIEGLGNIHERSVPRDSTSHLLTPVREWHGPPIKLVGAERHNFMRSPANRCNGSPAKSLEAPDNRVNRASNGTNKGQSPGVVTECKNNGTLDYWVRRSSPLRSPSRNQGQPLSFNDGDEESPVTEMDLDRRFGSPQRVEEETDPNPCRNLHTRTPASPPQSSENNAQHDDHGLHPSNNLSSAGMHGTHAQERSNMPTLQEALDFERRKREVMQHQRRTANVGVGTAGAEGQSPGRNLRSALATGRAAVTFGRQQNPGTVPPSRGNSKVSPSPRRKNAMANTYTELYENNLTTSFMCHQQSLTNAESRIASNPTRRVAADRPSLETVSGNTEIHHLSTTVNYSFPDLPLLAGALSGYDAYIQSGNSSYGLLQPQSSYTIQYWSQRLSDLIQKQCPADASESDPMSSVNLCSILEQHRDTHGDPAHP